MEKLFYNGYFMGTFSTAVIVIIADILVGMAWPAAVGCIIGVGISAWMDNDE